MYTISATDGQTVVRPIAAAGDEAMGHGGGGLGLSRLFGLSGLFGLFRLFSLVGLSRLFRLCPISGGLGLRGRLAPSLGQPQLGFGGEGFPRSRSRKIEEPPPLRERPPPGIARVAGFRSRCAPRLHAPPASGVFPIA